MLRPRFLDASSWDTRFAYPMRPTILPVSFVWLLDSSPGNIDFTLEKFIVFADDHEP